MCKLCRQKGNKTVFKLQGLTPMGLTPMKSLRFLLLHFSEDLRTQCKLFTCTVSETKAETKATVCFLLYCSVRVVSRARQNAGN